MTTAGSLALEGFPPAPRDAFLVPRRLRQAGVVILGKTNLSEWANFRSIRSTSGWSARGGQVQKSLRTQPQPLRVEFRQRVVAVAANLGAVAIGTETDGSIVCPASVNGGRGDKANGGSSESNQESFPIYHKPRIPLGPMARTVADATILLDCDNGRRSGPQDASHEASFQGGGPDYTKAFHKKLGAPEKGRASEWPEG